MIVQLHGLNKCHVLFVSSESMKCRLLKWLLDHPMNNTAATSDGTDDVDGCGGRGDGPHSGNTGDSRSKSNASNSSGSDRRRLVGRPAGRRASEQAGGRASRRASEPASQSARVIRDNSKSNSKSKVSVIAIVIEIAIVIAMMVIVVAATQAARQPGSQPTQPTQPTRPTQTTQPAAFSPGPHQNESTHKQIQTSKQNWQSIKHIAGPHLRRVCCATHRLRPGAARRGRAWFVWHVALGLINDSLACQLSACLPACLPARPPARLPACLPESLASWLPGCLASWLPGFLDSWLPGSLASWLPGCLASWLPGCLGRWLPAWLPGWRAGIILSFRTRATRAGWLRLQHLCYCIKSHRYIMRYHGTWYLVDPILLHSGCLSVSNVLAHWPFVPSFYLAHGVLRLIRENLSMLTISALRAHSSQPSQRGVY